MRTVGFSIAILLMSAHAGAQPGPPSPGADGEDAGQPSPQDAADSPQDSAGDDEEPQGPLMTPDEAYGGYGGEGEAGHDDEPGAYRKNSAYEPDYEEQWIAADPLEPGDPKGSPHHPSDRHPYAPDELEFFYFGLYGVTTHAVLDQYELGTLEAEPDPLVGKNLRLNGEGPLIGGEIRGVVQGDSGWRLGIAASIRGASELRLVHQPLEPGVAASLDDVWLAGYELFLGKAFDAHPVFPYVDVKNVLNVVIAEVDLEVAGIGYVGQTQYTVLSYTVAPRAGVLFKLDDSIHIDIAGQYGLFGLERAGLYAGFGLWDR